MIKSSLSEKYPLRLTDNIWLLGNYFINLYLVKGAKFSALIELGVTATADTVIDQLDSLGVAPDYLIMTHPHTDHISGLPILMNFFNKSRLVAGAGARKFTTHPKAQKGMVYEDRFITDMLEQMNIQVRKHTFDTFTFPKNYIRIDKQLEIDLGNITLRCKCFSGHSPGNIIVYAPERKALFVSDSLGFHYPGRGFCPLFFTGYSNFLDTLWILEAFKPDLLGPGHQGPIIGPAVKKAFTEAREESHWILNYVRNSVEDKETLAYMLFKKYYVDEFTLYSKENIMNCCRLLVRRAREKLQE